MLTKKTVIIFMFCVMPMFAFAEEDNSEIVVETAKTINWADLRDAEKL